VKLKDLGKKLETGGKSLLRGSLLKLLPKPRPHEGPPDPAKVRRILAVRHDARLGNLLLLTPALRLLKAAFPKARVEVLLADRYGDALKFNPCVDELLTAKALAGLRGRGFDLAFDFSPQHAFSLSSAVWTALSGAKRRIGFDRGDAATFLDDLVPVPSGRAHETANLAALVRHAAPGAALPPDASLRTEYHFGPGEKEAGAKAWASWSLDRESVALFLGARAEKRLDPSWFFDLGERLVKSGRKAVLTGGPAERKLLEGLTIPAGVIVAPELPLRAFAAAIVNARAVLTADTGPMHLAVALGVPTVQLFSHTEPWRFGYALPEHRLLETPGRHPTTDEAWAALSGLLAAKR
jgi:heptosyltransferase-3